MNKTVLGVAMVVVFCITWWLVAGEAKQERVQADEQLLQALEEKYISSMQVSNTATASFVAESAYRVAVSKFNQAAEASDEAAEALVKAESAISKSKQAVEQAKQVNDKAEQAVEQAKQAAEQARQAVATTQKWGIGAGLLADVLLLVGALAWSKLTAKA